MELSRAALSAYDARLAKQEDAAARYVRGRLERFMAARPNASVAEVREFAIEVCSSAAGLYGDAASAIAADLYEELAEAAGESVRTAQIDTSDVDAYIEKEVHYQAGKLAGGAPTAFAAKVAQCAADQVARRANQTMRKNAARDGIKYARVPMGGETCTFCAMLASRGFVYRSKSAAGEGNHYHRGCRCKVVPGFTGQTVQGYDPDEWLGRWRAMEDIDNDAGLSQAEKLAAKRRLAGGRGGMSRSAEVYSGLTGEQADAIERIVRNASGNAKELYLRHEGAFAAPGLSDNGGSYYSPRENRVYFNGLDKVFGGNGKEVADTWFHEFGHNVDWVQGGGRSFAESWHGGTFQNTIRAEVKRYIMKRKADVPGYAERMIREEHDTDTLVRWGLLDESDARLFWWGQIAEDELVKRIKRPGYRQACRMVGHEMAEALPYGERHALSDIYGGATRNMAVDGWGHQDSYWDTRGNALAHEAFAEMFAGSISSPGAMRLLRERLPESCKIFDKMLEEVMRDGGKQTEA